jgi:hypothetical protein
MPTKRQDLAEFSPEVATSDIIGENINSQKNAANQEYRRQLAASPEDNGARIAKIAAGETVGPYIDPMIQKRATANLCRDLDEAAELHHKKDRAIRHKALTELGKALVPEEREYLKRIGAGLVDAHLANLGYQELKSYLIEQGGCVGICLTDTENVLGQSSDHNSHLAMLLRQLISLGVLNKLPRGLA